MCGFGMANGTEFFALMKGTCAGAKSQKGTSCDWLGRTGCGKACHDTYAANTNALQPCCVTVRSHCVPSLPLFPIFTFGAYGIVM